MKTDNTYLKQKIQLRIDCLNGKKEVSVLDCFAGTGKLWDYVKKSTNININIIGIEKEYRKNKMTLIGDNRKYLKTIDLKNFDIIDLDSYGIPFDQLEILFERNYKGIIIVTAIQSIFGTLPDKMLYKLGYTDRMIKKIPTLFYRDGFAKLKNYLYINGIKKIEGYFIGRKNYFYFNLN